MSVSASCLGYCLCLKHRHLLRLLLVMFCFCISALPEFDRSIAVGWKSFTCLHPARETPQLNIVLFAFAPSLMLHVLKSKTKCARPVRPAQTKSYDGGDDDLLRLQKSGRPTDGSGHDRLVGWYPPGRRYSSLHRHVAVGVVHERRRVQGGGHVLVAEL